MSTAQGGSLIVAGFECWPQSPLATYTVASDEFGLGDPTALTRAIEQVSLDGERITGRRHGNRLLNLLIVIRASTRQSLDLASGQLEMAVNADTWNVQWTPPHLTSETPLPVIYESYRAVTVIEYDVELLDPSYVAGAQFVRAIKIEAPAFPFGKSPTSTTITATANVLTLDDFDYAILGGLASAWVHWPRFQPTGTPVILTPAGNWTVDTSDKTQGTESWSATESGASGGDLIRCSHATSAFIGGVADLTAYASLSLDVKLAGTAPTSMQFFLYDTSSRIAQVTVSLPTSGAWQTVSMPISSFTTNATDGFDWTHVQQWMLQTTPYLVTSSTVAPTMKIDYLRAYPRYSVSVNVANGGTYRFSGVPGTARANVSLIEQAATGQTFGSLIAHRGPSEARSDYTPVVPLSSTTAPPYSVNLPTYNSSTSGQRWYGTHAIWLGITSLNGAGSRTVTVTFSQSGPGSPSTSITRTFVPTDAANGLLFLGTVTLPVRAQPDGTTDITANTTLTWTVSIDDTNTADRYADLLVLDVRGPTVVIVDGQTQAVVVIDEPTPTSGVGFVYAGADITHLYATPGNALVSGGPFTFEPGDNIAVFYSPQGAPTASATFQPRWLSTRGV